MILQGQIATNNSNASFATKDSLIVQKVQIDEETLDEDNLGRFLLLFLVVVFELTFFYYCWRAYRAYHSINTNDD